ncbi:hypothetical protein [Myroides profundi]|uniref:Uncharacterized protein n=1 Tax=Myroides profundi TaxID=480520 RepID=A0AAJ4W1W8_MYRPR|nr:hypothetical protein [Myroides profundi]AJH14822.1 hypothetical protein MPR_1642 [Myroides profundi]SEQ23752.1 hypothetical protein SAMN04488089_102139 [Myroides profundi]
MEGKELGIELDKNLHRLLRHLDSIKDTLPMSLLLLEPHNKKANTKLKDFIEKNSEEIEDENGNKSISLEFEQARIFDQLAKNSEISNLAMKIIPESLFVALISQYDAFLNQLFKTLFKIRPEYINKSERELSFSQLNEFESIEKAREYVVEKEVETILRKSHSEHFDYLENKLSIVLRKDLPIWQTFIEITERRNLFVHCDGIVSNQYLKVCKENKCNISEIELNKRLTISSEYFKNAYECLYELSTKLTHTIWRKLIKEDIQFADEKLNEICYNLITNRQFNLADILLDFACKQIKFYNDSAKNYYTVNKALSKYLQDKTDIAREIIDSKDWSASSDDFKLAHLILMKKNDEAYLLMKKIGKNGEVNKDHYKIWPLFYKLRKEERFKEVFREIFEEDYAVLEVPKRPIQELIGEIIKKSPTLLKKKPTKTNKQKEIPKKRSVNKKATNPTDVKNENLN